MFCFAIYYVHNRFFRHISADIFVQYAQFNVVEYLKHGNPINRTKKRPGKCFGSSILFCLTHPPGRLILN